MSLSYTLRRAKTPVRRQPRCRPGERPDPLPQASVAFASLAMTTATLPLRVTGNPRARAALSGVAGIRLALRSRLKASGSQQPGDFALVRADDPPAQSGAL